MKKYVVYPSYARSDDGDVHFISAHRLMQLYKVSPVECVVVDKKKPETLVGDVSGLIPLRVQYGNYELKEKK